MIRFALILALCAAACGGGDDDTTPSQCADETRALAYVPGMAVDGAQEQFMVMLVDADPAPPAKGDNYWMIMVHAMDTGDPVDGAVLEVTPFMPDHGHGTSIVPVVTPDTEPGTYIVDPINLWMPGLWEVRIDVDDGADLITFPFCIEG
ncbi:MAG TPA: FixH family protein [Kofleriaceae bacterium]|nr:FixH family protein [Kofleriaceae bacterium]